MTKEDAKTIFLNRGYIELDGGSYFDGNKWRESIVVISEWLKEEPCEAVSREAVKSALCELCGDKNSCPFVNGDCDDLNAINALPPVTPKQRTGKWIRVTDKAGHLIWKCDKCEWQQRFNTNFCPDCGAKMEGVSE